MLIHVLCDTTGWPVKASPTPQELSDKAAAAVLEQDTGYEVANPPHCQHCGSVSKQGNFDKDGVWIGPKAWLDRHHEESHPDAPLA